jgi:hypothetical protein
VGSRYSWAQTNNSTECQVQSVSVSNITYIVVFANKTILNIDNQTRFVSSVVGNNLGRVQEAIAKTLNISPSEQLREEAGEILRGGISGSNYSNLGDGDNKKVECVKSGDKIFYYMTDIVPSKEVTNLTKGIESSIVNGTLGYKSLYEKTTSPKIFTSEQQAMINKSCEYLKNNYSSLSVNDRNWYFANCENK